MTESWNAARLIPTAGINGPVEEEKRGTSAFLAVLAAVPELQQALLRPLGVPKGKLETFIEVPFSRGKGRKKAFPDGLIRVTRGGRSYTLLVEAKTGTNSLNKAQLEMYLDIAKDHDFAGVLTISNEVAPRPGIHPVREMDTRGLALHHLSWNQVLTEAVLLADSSGVDDPCRAWVLSELIRYLEHPRSGAMEFADMGPSWVPVRDAARSNTLREGNPDLDEVSLRFDALIQFVCLLLGRVTGGRVISDSMRGEHKHLERHTQIQVSKLVKEGVLDASIRTPNGMAPLVVTADLRAARLRCEVTVQAPEHMPAVQCCDWLVEQLESAGDDTFVEIFTGPEDSGALVTLGELRAEGVEADDPALRLDRFVLSRVVPMSTKRSGRDSIVECVVQSVTDFHAAVLSSLEAWSPEPSVPRQQPKVPYGDPEMVSTALSSQDGPLPKGFKVGSQFSL